MTSAVEFPGFPLSIYDEVGVGIGGRVAEIVGSKLRTLGQDRQVLCITHLPQVAVQGEGHLRVTKASGTRNPGWRLSCWTLTSESKKLRDAGGSQNHTPDA
ncbi:MAG: hypothetical protein Ct9H300mP13_0570 [Gammaproteobacteria bacterium]|nr:MAG: hypothetical protein Ct9H300mP13_0570 [Gammaproteobacteria bacterium]